MVSVRRVLPWAIGGKMDGIVSMYQIHSVK